MKTKSDKQKNNQMIMKLGHSPAAILLVVLLAVTILVLNILSFSFSWFTPVDETKHGMEFDEKYTLRSENCTFQTFEGEKVTEDNIANHSGYYIDQIAYNSDQIEDNHTFYIAPGERVYFRTVIQNQDREYPSVISLYHHRLPAKLTIAVTYPSNTYYTPDANYDDCFILRNAYVKVRDDNDVDGPGILTVEWFVENSSSATIPFKVTKQTQGADGPINATADNPIYWLYLMYN